MVLLKVMIFLVNWNYMKEMGDQKVSIKLFSEFILLLQVKPLCQVEPKFGGNVHWMVLYKIYVCFC
jgi:hypothetical protein